MHCECAVVLHRSVYNTRVHATVHFGMLCRDTIADGHVCSHFRPLASSMCTSGVGGTNTQRWVLILRLFSQLVISAPSFFSRFTSPDHNSTAESVLIPLPGPAGTRLLGHCRVTTLPCLTEDSAGVRTCRKRILPQCRLFTVPVRWPPGHGHCVAAAVVVVAVTAPVAYRWAGWITRRTTCCSSSLVPNWHSTGYGYVCTMSIERKCCVPSCNNMHIPY